MGARGEVTGKRVHVPIPAPALPDGLRKLTARYHALQVRVTQAANSGELSIVNEHMSYSGVR